MLGHSGPIAEDYVRDPVYSVSSMGAGVRCEMSENYNIVLLGDLLSVWPMTARTGVFARVMVRPRSGAWG